LAPVAAIFTPQLLCTGVKKKQPYRATVITNIGRGVQSTETASVVGKKIVSGKTVVGSHKKR